MCGRMGDAMTAQTEEVNSGRVTVLVSRVLARNAGPMVLDGTNTYVIRHPDSSRVAVVDPGPDDDDHLRAVMAHGEVELILLTHYHPDHSDAAQRLSSMTGAPVRAIDPGFCVDAEVLQSDEQIVAGGTHIRIVGSPGHTADSVSFYLGEDRPLEQERVGESAGSMLTGDTILGRGTTVIAHPDGSVGQYLTSLKRLGQFGSALVLPGHGPVLHDLADVSTQHYEVRTAMLRVVEDVVTRFTASSPPREVTVRAVSDAVYSTLPRHLRFAAELSVSAQLAHLGVPVRSGPLALDSVGQAASSLPLTDLGREQVAPVTSASSLGAWLDHPEGGPLLRNLLTQVGVGEGVLAPLAKLSLEKLMIMSKGLVTQELVDDLVQRAAHPETESREAPSQ